MISLLSGPSSVHAEKKRGLGSGRQVKMARPNSEGMKIKMKCMAWVHSLRKTLNCFTLNIFLKNVLLQQTEKAV